jgi:hypothetical protein
MTPTEVAIFIRQEYRTQEAHDSTVKARFVNARQVSIDTDLDGTTAKTVANDYLATYGKPMMAFDIEIDGTVELDAFIPAPPQYVVTIANFCTARTMRVVGINVNEFEGTSTITVMG